MGVSVGTWWESTDRLRGEGGCVRRQGKFRGLPRPAGSRNFCCRGPCQRLWGSRGMAGSGVMGSCGPCGPALSLGPGKCLPPQEGSCS